jgi:hypothetical protein
MMINHIAGLIGGGCEVGYQYVAFNRSLEAGGDVDRAYGDFKKKVVENTVSILEKFLDLIMDIVHLIGKAVPAGFRLPVTLAIGALGVTKEWLKLE